MKSYKRVKLSAQLPPTTCTPELRKKIVSIAEQHGVSIGEIQRTAFEFFLLQYDSKTLNTDNYSILNQEQAS